MSIREVVITLVRADGESLDVTHRVAKGGLGTLSAEIEIDLGDLAHDDITLSLDDLDEEVKRFLSPFSANEITQLIIERETLRRRPKWERVFGGVLNLPWSYYRNRKTKLTELHAFSYTKVAENASAETIVRTFPAIGTGSVSLGARTVTLGSTTGLTSGDVVRLSDDDNTQDFTIDRVSTGTQFFAVGVADFTFTAAIVEVVTAFPRWITPAALAAQLVAQTDDLLEPGSLDMDHELSSVPIITPMSQDGLAAETVGGSIAEVASGLLEVVMTKPASSADSGRYQGTPRGTFTRVSATADARGDWTPYLRTRPTNFPALAGFLYDTGLVAWDHDNNRTYHLDINVETAPSPDQLRILRNGSVVEILDDYNGSSPYWGFYKLEFYHGVDSNELIDLVWFAYRRSDNSKNVLGVYDPDTDTVTEHSSSHTAGHLRAMKPLDVMAWVSEDLTTIKLYHPLEGRVLRTVSGDAVPPGLIPWTLRYFDGYIYACYRQRGRIFVRIWDSNWDVLSDLDFAQANPSGSVNFHPVTCVYDDPTYGKIGVVWNCAGGGERDNVLGLISKKYAGVIPYANLEGMSRAGALRDLAIASLSVVRTDHYGLVSILSRTPDLSHPIEIDNLILEDEEIPVWESYREVVRVTGTDAAGDEIDETTGVMHGSSARDFEVSSKFIQTRSHARAVGTAYASFLSVEREQRDQTIIEPEEPLEPLSVVLFEDRKFVVIPRVSSDFDRGQQEITIVEAPGQ